jgi:hypothetical protein
VVITWNSKGVALGCNTPYRLICHKNPSYAQVGYNQSEKFCPWQKQQFALFCDMFGTEIF